MSEHPVFVPVAGGHVAAVVTLPQGTARGVVLLLAGTGRHNAIGSTLSASLSVELAQRGLASARLDYGGVGDSPGLVERWSPSDSSAATEQARAVLRVVCEAAGVERFAEVGTCYGSRVALALVEEPGCVGAICLAPPILDFGGVASAGRGLRDKRLAGRLLSSPTFRRVVLQRLRPLLRARKPAPRVLGAFAHLDRARVSFLYGERSPQADHYSRRAAQTVESTIAGLPAEVRGRFELTMLPGGPLTTFDGLPPHEQDEILGAVVPRVTALFEH
jgi:predicted alpha/beta-hydrolase family hydrolase